MSVRVVLLAEGSGETPRTLKAPGARIAEDEFGPAHHLVRRTLSTVRNMPEGAIRFEEPLRHRLRVARGSDLLGRPTLRQLLTWPDPDAVAAPQLAIVLVDADGDPDRETMVRGHLDSLPVATTADCVVVAVAVQEFEAWLLADLQAVRGTLSLRIDHIDPPEAMPRGEAKRRLGALIAEAGRDSRNARLSIARMCELEVLRGRCPAFARFAEQLRVS